MKKLLTTLLLMLPLPAAAQNYLRDNGTFQSVVTGTISGQILTNSGGDLSGISGSQAVGGSIGITVTNPTLSTLSTGFEPLTLLSGISSNVLLNSSGANTGTVGVYGAIENQKGGVAGGVWGAVKDSVGAENYGVTAIFEVNHASSSGAILGAYLRGNQGQTIAPNATPYSGNNGINVYNENVLSTTGVANGAIGVYINAQCYPTSSISATCPAGGSSDNTWTIGLNVASARDEGIRIGSSSTNGYIPTKPITVYSTASALLWYLDNLGNTHANSYFLDSLSQDYKAVTFDGTSTDLWDSSGGADIGVSNSTNFYTNTTHLFRTRNAGSVIATLSVAGLVYTNIAAPSSPASGSDTIYTDSTDLRLHDKNSAGVIGTTVVSSTLASHNFANSISTAGVISGAQPVIADISGWGTGVATALGVNVGTAGSMVINGGALGTPSSGIATNLTGTASGLTAGNVTTNANLTGAVTSTGNATLLGSFSSANLLSALTDETGSGVAVFGTSPILTTVDARGVWTAGATWTLPAHTLGGTISGGAQQINNVGSLGIGGNFTPTNPLSFTGQSAQTIWMERETTSTTAGNDLTIQAGGAVSGGTDLKGGNLILSAGTGTGTAGNTAPNRILFFTAQGSGGSGTGDVAPSLAATIYRAGGFTDVCFSSVTCSATNSDFQSNGAGQTNIGTASGGAVNFRINNVSIATISGNNLLLPVVGGYLLTTSTTVASLQTCNAAAKGARSFVSDELAAVAFNTIATGSGVNNVPVFCDGTNWRIG